MHVQCVSRLLSMPVTCYCKTLLVLLRFLYFFYCDSDFYLMFIIKKKYENTYAHITIYSQYLEYVCMTLQNINDERTHRSKSHKGNEPSMRGKIKPVERVNEKLQRQKNRTSFMHRPIKIEWSIMVYICCRDQYVYTHTCARVYLLYIHKKYI